MRWLNDAYNANADSVRASLETLAALETAGRRFVVLGEMAELGEHAEDAHREAGELTASAAAGLVAIGRWADVTVEAARAAGLKTVESVPMFEVLWMCCAIGCSRGMWCYGRASRAAKLERIFGYFSPPRTGWEDVLLFESTAGMADAQWAQSRGIGSRR